MFQCHPELVSGSFFLEIMNRVQNDRIRDPFVMKGSAS